MKMRVPGIEPGQSAWEAEILTTRPYAREIVYLLSFSRWILEKNYLLDLNFANSLFNFKMK